jgi:hypothetical protein
MTAQKRSKRAKTGGSRAPKVSSAERPTARSMNYWLERISLEDMMRLWLDLKDIAEDVPFVTMLACSGNGITSREGFRVGVIASALADGFVLSFTERATSKSGAPR